MGYSFFAMLSRMKNINRWSLMRNTQTENLSEHSYEVATIAHGLAVIGKRLYGSTVDPNEVASAALYHDVAEIITGDLPTPIKYKNPNIKDAYAKIEQSAIERILAMLPCEIRSEYTELFNIEKYSGIKKYVKAADKISAYLKCIYEKNSGNRDFISAETQLLTTITALNMPEVDYFMQSFAPLYGKTLDELTLEK